MCKNIVDENMSFAAIVEDLLKRQTEEWELCGKNYADLSGTKLRKFDFEGVQINIQCNPGRITSTSAKVDNKSISERKCFLCEENRPAVQKGIDALGEYNVLVNPFPIFPMHYTITNKGHVQQRLLGRFIDMLNLSKDMGEKFLIFYNGPKCGASAPDHMHFQAGNLGFLPLEAQMEKLRSMSVATLYPGTSTVRFVDDGLRKMVFLEGGNQSELNSSFETVFASLQRTQGIFEEPMMNVISYFQPESETYSVIIFVRKKHRPECYFAEGEKQIMLSPAAVDIGGTCITPRQEDFEKITADDLKQIFHEVFVDEDYFLRLQNEVAGTI
ncbi:MAG: DUF4922 domain-containing protein [Ignavibacteria bacterium]|nr:DUF4922 domain-containing protein [Ignavibacteria bacterium]